MMLFLRFLHFVGAALYFGAVVGAWASNGVAAKQAREARAADLVTFWLLRLANAGIILLLASGVAVIGLTGMYWMKLPWMHLMLTGFLGAGAVTGIAQAKARALTESSDDPERARRRIATMSLVGALFGLAAIAAGTFRF